MPVLGFTEFTGFNVHNEFMHPRHKSEVTVPAMFVASTDKVLFDKTHPFLTNEGACGL